MFATGVVATSPEESDLLRRSTFKAKGTSGSAAPERKPLSYKDIVSGINGRYDDEEDDDFIDNSGSEMEEEEDPMESDNDEEPVVREEDPLCPAIKVTKQEIKEARDQWRNVVIVKLVGGKVGLGFLKGRLARLWNPTGEMEVIDLNHDYFVIQFGNAANYNHVFDGGPWIILGHYLVVQQWKLEFKPTECELGEVVVWVRIHDFPI